MLQQKIFSFLDIFRVGLSNTNIGGSYGERRGAEGTHRPLTFKSKSTCIFFGKGSLALPRPPAFKSSSENNDRSKQTHY